MTPIPAKVLAVAKQSSQYRVLVQIELDQYLGSFRALRFGKKIPFTGSCHNGQLDPPLLDEDLLQPSHPWCILLSVAMEVERFERRRILDPVDPWRRLFVDHGSNALMPGQLASK